MEPLEGFLLDDDDLPDWDDAWLVNDDSGLLVVLGIYYVDADDPDDVYVCRCNLVLEYYSDGMWGFWIDEDVDNTNQPELVIRSGFGSADGALRSAREWINENNPHYRGQPGLMWERGLLTIDRLLAGELAGWVGRIVGEEGGDEAL